jgi:succinate-semialdehyde dehydrogenase/glutarate-semialdehyde dehydrogenase
MSKYAVINPATGETLQSYETATDAEIAAAVDAAAAAYRDWSRSTTREQRAAMIHAVAELHRERRQHLAEIIVREMGKNIEAALGEVDFSADIYDYYADRGPELLADEPVELAEGSEGSAVIRKSALGVLLGIMPWNFPYYQVSRFAGPNLILGNTILLKHAAQCPESAAAIHQIFADAGFPVGAYVNIYATTDQIGTIIADPRVAGISLTGSEGAGAAVAEQAGRHLKKVVLELGGSDPFIVLSTDDLDATVQMAVDARLDNSGQSCNGAKRFIVIDSLYDAFLTSFAEKMSAAHRSSDPMIEGGAYGPLSSASAAEGLHEQVTRAVADGAEIVAGGTREGTLFAATVLAGVTPGNSTYYEEFLGPVAQVFKVHSEDEAVELANDTPFGLGSYLFTTDADQAIRVADQIDAGMVYVNCVLSDSPELPFGGVKRSGSGRELGTLGIDEFVNKKMIRIA